MEIPDDDDAQQGDENLKVLVKEPPVVIPLQSNEDVIDKGDSWRVWSCIRLAYLLRDAISSVSEADLQAYKEHLQGLPKFPNTKVVNEPLKKRGKYLTRRFGKYWWPAAVKWTSLANAFFKKS